MPRSLYHHPIAHYFLKKVNNGLQKNGLSQTFKSIADEYSRGFIINSSPQTLNSLQHDPLILICNHPSQAEVFLTLGALPPRQNIFMISIHNLLGIIPALDKHLIPVYINHRLETQNKFDWKTKLLNFFHYSPVFSKNEAHQKNIDSIKLAAQKIDQNSLVIIFPAGGTDNGRDFLPGVGYLVNQVKKYRQAKIVFAHASGTSTFDFLRLLPFVDKLMPDFKIEFSPVYSLSDFRYANPKISARQLQGAYDHWSTPFYNLPAGKAFALYLRSILFFLLFK